MKRIVRTPAEWNVLVETLLKQKQFSYDTEYENRGWPNLLPVGMSFSWKVRDKLKRKKVRHSAYVPLNHYTSDDAPAPYVNPKTGKPLKQQPESNIGHWYRIPNQLTTEQVRPGLRKLVTSGKRIVTHNAQAELKILHIIGVETNDGINLFDTMLASWLLETDRWCGHGLKELTKKMFGYKMHELHEFTPYEWVADTTRPALKSGPRKGKLNTKKTGVLLVSRAPIEICGGYAQDDATYTLRLYEKFKKELAADPKLEKVYYGLLMEVVQYLCEMEEHGMIIDKDGMEAFIVELRKELKRQEQKIFDLRPGKRKGKPFKISSSKELNEVLYGECGIDPATLNIPLGKNKLYSTKKKYLAEFAFLEGHEICTEIIAYNGTKHLLGMMEGWVERAVKHPDGSWRLHGSFSMHTVRTGRLSSRDPNLQNIPVRDKKRPVRKFFLAPKGYLFGDHDYAQIELKILAHFSKDKRMCKIMNAGGDLHSETAKIAYHLKVPPGLTVKEEGEYIKEKFPSQRANGKGVNFATVYGAGAKTIAMNNGMPLDEAEKIVSGHPEIFPEAHKWMNMSKKLARKFGHVKTILGRMRHLPNAQIDIWKYPKGSQEFRDACKKKAGAERQAVNSRVQGSAADIIMIAMRNIRRHFLNKGLWFSWVTNREAPVRPGAQVHDELVLYYLLKRAKKYGARVTKIMNEAMKLRVPIEADGNVGGNWIEAK